MPWRLEREVTVETETLAEEVTVQTETTTEEVAMETEIPAEETTVEVESTVQKKRRRTTTTGKIKVSMTTTEEDEMTGDPEGKNNNNNNNRRDKGKHDDDRRRQDDQRPEKRKEGDNRDKDSNRLTGRQSKALQAKELQMSYQKGAKRCVEKILGDTQKRRQCGIPPKAIHEHMTKTYSTAGRRPYKPAWIQGEDGHAGCLLCCR